MKILLTARWPVGGIRTYFRYIYGQRIFLDEDITIIGPDLNLREFLVETFPERDVNYISCGNSNADFKRVFKETLKENRFDIIHSHGYSAGLLSILPSIFYPAPHIMTAHDVHLDEQFCGAKGFVRRYLISLAFSMLDAVLTVGKDCESNFIEFMPTVPKRKIFNIDHGVDVERFAYAQHRHFHMELGLDRNVKILGFFGRFMPQKGFLDIVHAIKHLSEQLPEDEMPVVVTFGWGGYIREYFKEIESLGLADYFIQMPFTDDVPSAIKGVDIVLMPSHWEACGLLAMEVLAAGKPLIGTDCLGLRCVLEGTPAHVAGVGDSIALAEAVQLQMGTDESAFFQYQPIAKKRFNMQRPAEELYRFYQKVLGVVA